MMDRCNLSTVPESFEKVDSEVFSLMSIRPIFSPNKKSQSMQTSNLTWMEPTRTHTICTEIKPWEYRDSTNGSIVCSDAIVSWIHPVIEATRWLILQCQELGLQGGGMLVCRRTVRELGVATSPGCAGVGAVARTQMNTQWDIRF